MTRSFFSTAISRIRPEVIPALYEKWREGNDVVYGRRSRREAPAIMAMAYKAFYRVFRAASYVPVPLDAGDFALMDRRVVDELLALPETDQFLRGLRAWVGFKQTGVDYVRPERAFGRSTHSRLKNLWWAKKAIFSFSFLPIEVLGYVAAAMTALSFAAVVYEIVDSLRRPELSHGVSALIVSGRVLRQPHAPRHLRAGRVPHQGLRRGQTKTEVHPEGAVARRKWFQQRGRDGDVRGSEGGRPARRGDAPEADAPKADAPKASAARER